MKQLSVFLENKKGSLADITSLLTESEIDIHAMSMADTHDFGILRLLVSDTEKALKALEEKGIIASVTNVVVASMGNTPGSLSSILTILSQADINIEYMYAFTATSVKEAYAVFRFEDTKAGTDVLTAHNIKLRNE